MKKAITIQIPKPCHEDWNIMTPIEKGRHCTSCAKTVHDFTTKTDEQIIKTLEQSGAICGRYKNSQLNRELAYNRKDTNDYWSYVASGIVAMMTLLTTEVAAQENLELVPETEIRFDVSVTSKHEKEEADIEARLITVVGTVTDEFGQPLPGVTIEVKETNIGVSTDFDGLYSIEVEEAQVVVVSYLGYRTVEVKAIDLEKNVVLFVDDEELMGEMIVVGYGAIFLEHTEEELERQRSTRQQRNENNKKFYDRKRQEKWAAQKLRRQHIQKGVIQRTKFGKLLYKMTHFSK